MITDIKKRSHRLDAGVLYFLSDFDIDLQRSLQTIMGIIASLLVIVVLFLALCSWRSRRNTLGNRYVRTRLLHGFVGGTHQLAAGDQFLDPVCTPAGQTGCRE